MIENNYSDICEKIQVLSQRLGVVVPRLLAVSKKKPVEAISALYQLGHREFGESYAQEGVFKIQQLSGYGEIIWHFIGPIQSNKVHMIARYFDWVQSLSREKIAKSLNRYRDQSQKPVQVLVQVKIGDENNKSGVEPDKLEEFLGLCDSLPRIHLRGLMCIPPHAKNKKIQAAYFRELKGYYDLYQQKYGLDTLSMGMSGDYVTAIENGSSLIRLGTAIFGERK